MIESPLPSSIGGPGAGFMIRDNHEPTLIRKGNMWPMESATDQEVGVRVPEWSGSGSTQIAGHQFRADRGGKRRSLVDRGLKHLSLSLFPEWEETFAVQASVIHVHTRPAGPTKGLLVPPQTGADLQPRTLRSESNWSGRTVEHA